ncbi:trypsin-like serine peptidase [Azospirillum halopraeferens]|uniref:trypsin-like serine peptidase n=1 Tax=Azospirillum halopraeferens TaxID=34010 RepID=UPI000687809C|nr:trypsin-like peptidase domain-containing protein [Azospirillum halopraeferens]
MTTCSPWHSAVAGAALALATLAAMPAGAGTANPLLPGVAAGDRRSVVDVETPPWTAVVRVQTNLGGRCTGVLAAPDRVVTAAHCLFNGRTRRLFAAQSLHVLFGYARGDHRVHRRVAHYTVGAGYDGTRPVESLPADWAVLTLVPGPDPGVAPLAVTARPPPPDTPVALAGFSQDRAHLLMADRDCRLLDTNAGGLLLHDCSGSRGVSGGPLLHLDGSTWTIVGLGVAVSGLPDGANFAVPARAFHPALTQ